MQEADKAITDKENQCQNWRAKYTEDNAQYEKEIAIIK